MLAALPFPTRQGTQVVIDALCESLAQRGHEIGLYTYGPPCAPLARTYTHIAVGQSEVGERSGPSFARVRADVRLASGVLRALTRAPPDLIHAHHFEALPIGLLMRRVTGRPLVYHAHSALGPELPSYFRRAAPLAYAMGSAFDRLLPRRADAVVVFDAHQAALYARLGVAHERLHVVAPGVLPIPADVAAPQRISTLRAQLGDGPIALYAGNPDAYQNLPLLGRALALARQALPTLKLLVLSHHAPALFAAQWRHLALGDEVVYTPLRDDGDLAAAHAVATFGVVPRTLAVGAPVKVINYLLAGLPVVACRASAALLDGAAGVLVDPEPRAFADGMLAAVTTHDRVTAGALAQRYLATGLAPAYERIYDLLH